MSVWALQVPKAVMTLCNMSGSNALSAMSDFLPGHDYRNKTLPSAICVRCVSYRYTTGKFLSWNMLITQSIFNHINYRVCRVSVEWMIIGKYPVLSNRVFHLESKLTFLFHQFPFCTGQSTKAEWITEAYHTHTHTHTHTYIYSIFK